MEEEDVHKVEEEDVHRAVAMGDILVEAEEEEVEEVSYGVLMA